MSLNVYVRSQVPHYDTAFNSRVCVKWLFLRRYTHGILRMPCWLNEMRYECFVYIFYEIEAYG